MRTRRWFGDARSLGAACLVVAVLGSAGCSEHARASGGKPGAGTTESVSTTQADVRKLTLSAIDDFGTVDRSPPRIVGRDAAAVDVGFSSTPDGAVNAGPAVLRFAPVTLPASCTIADAKLHLTLTDDSWHWDIAVYPGNPAGLADEDRDGQLGGMLLDNRPRGVSEPDGATVALDATLLVRTWTKGGPFPSRGLTVDPAEPLALVVQPPDRTSPATFRLAMTEAGPAAAPTLVIVANC